ncbi:MAG: nucleotidyl transferase AbiEii/AbiGii toxin family protein [Betaproteobacteria bacterium]|nr:nucleotidyl transferase AbiEii/AbiGii toxin family protein [Betaproteobacteria bacterium]
MDAYLTMSPDERRQLCEVAGTALGVRAVSIEKDFWVCWTLRELFALPETGPHLTFKGGTSLSKCWKLIERFSEDIDVVIDRGFLGFGSERSPEATTGSKERQRRLEALKVAAQKHIHESLAPALERRLRASLPDESSWTVTNDSDDPDGQTLIFAYPSVFPASDYLRPAVKIEMGARSDIEPSATPSVQPYIAEVLPDALGVSAFTVQTLDPKRTFWEKSSLLHEETYRADARPIAARLARHYYDLWCLIRAGVGDAALADLELFSRVVAHRSVFFRRSREAQDALRPGSLCLLPSTERLADWRRDYDAMRETMFIGEPPEFDEILRVVGEFEQRFNRPVASSS